LALSVFAGCGAKQETGDGTPAATDSPAAPAPSVQETEAVKAREVSLRFSWWGGDTRHKATLDAIDAYCKKFPNVRIDAEYMAYDGFEKKLITQMAGGTAPDIFQNSPAWYQDIGTDYYVDLNKYSNLIDITQFNKSLLDECTNNGKLQALSAGVLATTVLYNKNFFQKFGIPEDTVWTYEKVLEIGKEVHAKDPEVYLLPTTDLDTVNRLILYPYLSQKTGDIWVKDDFTMAFDKPILVESLQYIRELYKSGAIEPMSVSTTTGQTDPKIINGQIGMFITLTSTIGATKALNPNVEYGVTQIPMHPDAKQSANPVRSSVVFSINAKSAEIEESAKFLNWLLNDSESAMILLEQRGTPASDAARKALTDNNKIDPLIAQAMEIASGNPGKIPNAPSENAEIWQINKDVITKLALDKATPEEGADEIIKKYTSKLKELKEAAGK
jgi:oligogalacturonide transport system substrate-binding protein